MKLIWTIKDSNMFFPPDEELFFNAAFFLKSDEVIRPIVPIHNYPDFGLERFGNSVHVYIKEGLIDDPHGLLKNKTIWRRVGLFTWGMTKQEAQ